MTGPHKDAPPQFDAAFRAALRDLVLWRRDVRRFRPDPVDATLVMSLIELAARSPSVGFSQPWRFVLVESSERREAVRQSFARANADALSTYADERRGLYAKLKRQPHHA
jgi:5,6-dimethylbenzimidazole synthase